MIIINKLINIENNLQSGIYKITNTINNKIYVGSTKDFKDRYYRHSKMLSKNEHYNSHLQRSFNKHGKENFTYEVLEFCDINVLFERERFYINFLKPVYNSQAVTEDLNNFTHSDKVKEVIASSSRKMWIKIKNGEIDFPILKGENNPFAKKSNTQILELKKDLASGVFTKSELEIKHKVNRKFINSVITLKSWISIGEEFNPYLNNFIKEKTNITKGLNTNKEKASLIKQDIVSLKYTGNEICEKYKISYRSLSAIKGLTNWKDSSVELNDILKKIILFKDYIPYKLIDGEKFYLNEKTRQEISKNNKGIKRPSGKKIVQTDLNKNVIKIWDYLQETKNFGFQPSLIAHCISGKQLSHRKSFWYKYEDFYNNSKI